MAINKDSKTYTLLFALVLCLVCSVLVSAAAIYLRPIQQVAQKDDKRKNILRVVNMYEPGMNMDAAFKNIETKIVDLDSGTFANDVDPAHYDQYAAAKDPAQGGVVLTTDQDIAKIKYRPRYATVYMVKDDTGALQSVILPVHGYGLWSTMYGFLALKPDGNTVVGINFYQHGETPGLGGEVDNQKWKAVWVGKHIYNAEGQVALHSVKGGVNPDQADAVYQVDALAGATLTTHGVDNTIRYWLSDAGFKPFLHNIAAQHVGE